MITDANALRLLHKNRPYVLECATELMGCKSTHVLHILNATRYLQKTTFEGVFRNGRTNRERHGIDSYEYYFKYINGH